MSESQQGLEIYDVICPNAILLRGILTYYHVNCMQTPALEPERLTFDKKPETPCIYLAFGYF